VAVRSNGCSSGISDSRIIALGATPSATVAGKGGFCKGDSVVLTASPGTGVQYQWTFNTIPIPGATAASFAASADGSYAVMISTASCSTISTGKAVAASPLPAKPVITLSGKQLSSSAAAGNQWYKDGVVLSGDTSQLYSPAATASYSVAVTTNGCTGPLSDPYAYKVKDTTAAPPGTVPVDSSQAIKLGPNPVKNELAVIFTLPGTPTVNLQICDLKGRVWRVWKGVASGTSVRLTGLPAGLYFAQISSSDGQFKKVIKVLKE
jgi:hypothetical protein